MLLDNIVNILQTGTTQREDEKLMRYDNIRSVWISEMPRSHHTEVKGASRTLRYMKNTLPHFKYYNSCYGLASCVHKNVQSFVNFHTDVKKRKTLV